MAIQETVFKDNIANFWANVKWSKAKNEKYSTSDPKVPTDIQLALQKAGIVDQEGHIVKYIQNAEKNVKKSTKKVSTNSGERAALPDSDIDNDGDERFATNKKKTYVWRSDSEGDPLTQAQSEFFYRTKIVDENKAILRVEKAVKKGVIWLRENFNSKKTPYYALAEDIVNIGNLNNKVTTNSEGKIKITANVRNIAKSIGCETSEIKKIVLDGNCLSVMDLVNQKTSFRSVANMEKMDWSHKKVEIQGIHMLKMYILYLMKAS